MPLNFTGHSLAALACAALTCVTFSPSPAMAQSDCTCVLPATGGPVGSISMASADVLVSGSVNWEPATEGIPLQSGSVVTTGPEGSATINLGASCSFSMDGSMRMQIVPQQNGLCVQVIDETLVSPPISGQTFAIAALAAGAGIIVFSLGMLSPASRQ